MAAQHGIKFDLQKVSPLRGVQPTDAFATSSQQAQSYHNLVTASKQLTQDDRARHLIAKNLQALQNADGGTTRQREERRPRADTRTDRWTSGFKLTSRQKRRVPILIETNPLEKCLQEKPRKLVHKPTGTNMIPQHLMPAGALPGFEYVSSNMQYGNFPLSQLSRPN